MLQRLRGRNFSKDDQSHCNWEQSQRREKTKPHFSSTGSGGDSETWVTGELAWGWGCRAQGWELCEQWGNPTALRFPWFTWEWVRVFQMKDKVEVFSKGQQDGARGFLRSKEWLVSWSQFRHCSGFYWGEESNHGRCQIPSLLPLLQVYCPEHLSCMVSLYLHYLPGLVFLIFLPTVRVELRS